MMTQSIQETQKLFPIGSESVSKVCIHTFRRCTHFYFPKTHIQFINLLYFNYFLKLLKNNVLNKKKGAFYNFNSPYIIANTFQKDF
ncbi:hypothetical protein KORDIASMS9_04458 [Kordia sp. SMS9]|nr:hypothetical protein KORDIASMS9_04458 [Kordia sp. SMS9]